MTLIQTTLKEFTSSTYQQYNSHSYSSGYYESTIANLFENLTKKQQKQFLFSMQQAVALEQQRLQKV
jgi:hypothetical protein